MKKIISSLLVFSVLFTSGVMCFAGSREVEQECCSVGVPLGDEDEVISPIFNNQEENFVADDLELSCEHRCAIRASGSVTAIVMGLIAIVGASVVAVGAIVGIAALTDLVGEAGVINIMLLFK